MNPIQIIKANPDFKKEVDITKPFLNVAEFFCNTIQGENFIGYPATFLRLQGCTQSCVWCDTKEVWRFGNPYSIEDLFILMEQNDCINKFKKGQHLVLTGGSPLLQQNYLLEFILQFYKNYGFRPYIEIENECTRMPGMISNYIDCWNNSPKLESSGNTFNIRYQPEILKTLSTFKNSWFKFVISKSEDWDEVQKNYLDPDLILRDQIVLMPKGATRDELIENREMVIELAIKHTVRYSTREHIVVWDKKTGI